MLSFTSLKNRFLTTDQQAVRWFLRLRDPDVTVEERAAFEAWKALPARVAAFERVCRVWTAVDGVSGQAAIRHVPDDVTTYGKVRRRALQAAAGVAFLVAGGLALSQGFPAAFEGLRTKVMLALAPAEGTFTTTIGQRTTVTLRDGTVLTLDTDSQARVLYTDQERKIVLDRGQALFEVAKGQPRPFIVHAGDRRIVATGTAFEVRLKRAAVEVTLVEGHVLVDPAGLAALEAGSRTELHAGERLVAKVGANVSVSSVNVERVTSWTSGKLIFLNTRLADAVDEVNRYTRAPVTLSDPALADMTINGVFRTGQPADFANAVAQVYPVSVIFQADGRIQIALAASR